MPISFRDPSGQVSDDGERIVRQVHPAARAEVDALLGSAVYAELTASGALIPASEIEATPQGGLRLTHPRIELPSYPFEWTASMLADAARLTLDIQAKAHAAGWTLKDASASNVLFEGSQPRFCDLLSLRPRHAEEMGWVAYGQFVRHFVLPLLALSTQGRTPREIFLAQRDGLRANELAPYLPWHRYQGLSSWLHVRWPARLEARRIARPQDTGTPKRPTGGADAVPWLLSDLRRYIDKLERAVAGKTAWSGYTANRDHYVDAGLVAKRQAVQAALSSQPVRHVLDIGANTGEFSMVGIAAGARVVAIDDDINALDQLHRQARGEQLPVQCLHVNLARPTPATGWNLGETIELPRRLHGRFDFVLMLAVVHHLCVTERLPLGQLFESLADLCTGTLLIEFVAKDDPRFIEIAGANLALYSDWSLPNFLQAAAPWFTLVDETPLSDHRRLLRLQRR